MGIGFPQTRQRNSFLLLLVCIAGQAADRDVPSRTLVPGKLFGAGEVIQLAYSPGGDSLAVLTTIGVQIRDAANGRLTRSVQRLDPPVAAFSWSPDGKRLALVADGVEIWDRETGSSERRMATNPGGRPFDAVAWSPDGTRIAAGSRDRVVVFEALSGHASVLPPPNGVTSGPPGAIGRFSWAPGGQELAVVSGFDSQVDVCLWDVRGLNVTRTISVSRYRRPPPCDLDQCGQLESPQSPRSLVAWAPDGQVLAVSSGNGLSILDARTGSLRRRLPIKEFVISMSWSVDSKLLRMGSYHEVRYLRRDTGFPVHSLRYPLPSQGSYVDQSTVSADGERLAASYFNHGVIETWQGSTNAPTQRIVIPSAGGFNISPDLRKAVVGDSWSAAEIWDVESGEELKHLGAGIRTGESYVWSPDSKLLLHVLAQDLQIVQPTDGRVTRSFQLPKSDAGPTVAKWSPDARHILVLNPRWSVNISLDTGAVELLPPGQGLPVWGRSATLVRLRNTPNFEWLQSPDLRYTALLDSPRVRFRDMQQDGMTKDLEFFVGYSASQLAWSPDSRRIAAVAYDNRSQVDVWDLAQARIVERFVAPGSRRLGFLSWRDKLVAIEYLGGAVRLWTLN